MIRTPFISSLISLSLLAGSQLLAPVLADELKGPILQDSQQGTTALPDKDKEQGMAGLGTAPGADAVMTQDMLLINPSGSGQNNANATPTQPLTAYIGMTLKLNVDPREVEFEDLHGLAITVVNDTTRPLVIDGDSTSAKVGDKSYKSAPLTALQLAVSPEHGIARVPIDLITIVAPTAATIGAYPTVRDLINYSKDPLTHRYGKDQERRVVEASRFGKRILWPHEKTVGIVYFQTKDSLNKAKVEIPVTTLFDKKDSGTLISSP